MNNKGFTLVELITTFALTATLIVLLVNIVLVIKDIYVKYEIKTELLIKQGDLYTALYNRIDLGDSKEYTTKVSSCGSGCYRLTFDDTTHEDIVVTSKKITFGDFVYKAPKGVTFNSELVNTGNVAFKLLHISINHQLYNNQDFGIKMVFTIPST